MNTKRFRVEDGTLNKPAMPGREDDSTIVLNEGKRTHLGAVIDPLLEEINRRGEAHTVDLDESGPDRIWFETQLERHGLNSLKVAEALGVNKSAISRLLAGERRLRADEDGSVEGLEGPQEVRGPERGRAGLLAIIGRPGGHMDGWAFFFEEGSGDLRGAGPAMRGQGGRGD